MRERAYRRQRPTQRPADPNITCHSSPGSLRLENHEFHTSLRCIMKPRKRRGKDEKDEGGGKGEGRVYALPCHRQLAPGDGGRGYVGIS